jgi:hypothetical protein
LLGRIRARALGAGGIDKAVDEPGIMIGAGVACGGIDLIAAMEDELAVLAAVRAGATHLALRVEDPAHGASPHERLRRHFRLPPGDDRLAVVGPSCPR